MIPVFLGVAAAVFLAAGVAYAVVSLVLLDRDLATEGDTQ